MSTPKSTAGKGSEVPVPVPVHPVDGDIYPICEIAAYQVETRDRCPLKSSLTCIACGAIQVPVQQESGDYKLQVSDFHKTKFFFFG